MIRGQMAVHPCRAETNLQTTCQPPLWPFFRHIKHHNFKNKGHPFPKKSQTSVPNRWPIIRELKSPGTRPSAFGRGNRSVLWANKHTRLVSHQIPLFGQPQGSLSMELNMARRAHGAPFSFPIEKACQSKQSQGPLPNKQTQTDKMLPTTWMGAAGPLYATVFMACNLWGCRTGRSPRPSSLPRPSLQAAGRRWPGQCLGRSIACWSPASPDDKQNHMGNSECGLDVTANCRKKIGRCLKRGFMKEKEYDIL